MIVGLAIILLGGLGVYYAITGREPVDALRRAITGQTSAQALSLTSFGNATTSRGITLDPRITEPHGGLNDTNRTGAIGIGQDLAAQRFGWTGRQWDALYKLWMRESGWSPTAVNPSSGASGIPQRLGHGPLPPNWSNPRVQILWGLVYIKARYGTPVKALAHSDAEGWY